MAMNRDTVGKISAELSQKTPETRDPIELEREMHKDYENHIYQCIERYKKEFPGDFYLVVITKKERLMQNVLRNLFTARLSCPTPDYDQAVYKYHRKDDLLEFLWVVPAKDICEYFREHALEVAPQERALRDMVLEFYDNTLLNLAKKLNGEMSDSLLIEQ